MQEYIGFDGYERRTAGLADKPVKTVQAWKKPKMPEGEAQKEILANLDKAAEDSFDEEVRTALSYAPQHHHSTQEEVFSFGDVIDVVNPLHHIPLVGMVYRGLTGDEIHPMSQIVGGALYGGPIGAATGTVNAVAKIQTGKDVADHALDFTKGSMFTTEDRTAARTRQSFAAIQELPDTTIAAVDLSLPVKREPITQMKLSPMPPAAAI